MEVRLLGPLEVVDASVPVPLPRGRARSLLGLLALHPGEVLPTGRLIDELWGPTPTRTATTALHGLVSSLRKRLDPTWDGDRAGGILQTRPPGYVLAVDPVRVDAVRFRRLVARAADAPPRERADQLRGALALWRGPALADFTYEPFAQAAITALEELRVTALEERLGADLAVGRHAEVVAELESLVDEHPLRERLRAHLMLALYRCGRQAEALAAHRDGRRILVEELGIEPGPALSELERAILAQAPSLDPSAGSLVPEEGPGTVPVPVSTGSMSWLPSGRRAATIVFVDLAAEAEGATDPASWQRTVGGCAALAADVLSRHGGTVEGAIGDVVVAVFGVPVGHPDDARRALWAAVELRRALTGLAARLPSEGAARLVARVGVNTGEVVVGDPGHRQAAVSGHAVKLAARLSQVARDGEVLVGEETRRAVGEDAVLEPVEHALSDGDGREIVAWRLLEVTSDMDVEAPDGLEREAPLIGRTEELARLRACFDRVVRERRSTLVTVLGEAGIGKSRLVAELVRSVEGRARVLTARGPPRPGSSACWPLRELLLQATDQRARARLADPTTAGDEVATAATEVAIAIGLLDGDARTAGPIEAVGRLLETLTASGPVIVVLEDAHGASAGALDLLDRGARSVRAPVLLVCVARPEPRAAPTTRQTDEHETVVLAPLDRAEGERLVAARTRGRALPAASLARVLETGRGNPLHLEQMVAALRAQPDRPLPATVHALLAARLDRLGPAERDVLRCAAVAGPEFPGRALVDVLPQAARPFVGRHLQALQDKALIRRSAESALGSSTFGFRHALVRDTAYRGTPEDERAVLHERFAGWLLEEGGTRTAELDEMIGHHLEQAHRLRRGLGLDDRRTRELGVRAGERLAAAGGRILDRLGPDEAEDLLARALALLPVDHPTRLEVDARLTAADRSPRLPAT